MKKRIASEKAIWDLHIHTNKCPKMSGEMGDLSDEDYILEITNILHDNPMVEMISFTDHNTFSLSVYEKYLNSNIDVTLLPGVEVDFYFEEGDAAYRQLIMYWDYDLTKDDQLIKFKECASKFNAFMAEQPEATTLYKLFEWLDKNNISAIFSPHAFKQQATRNRPGRGIDAEIGVNEDKAKRYPRVFSDQFFCFWESSGIGSRAQAEKFLRDFANQNEVSIISFSDTKKVSDFRNHIENVDSKTKVKTGPPQYFRSLPSFKGVQLVATENSRIIFNHHDLTNELINKTKTKENNTYISRVKFDEEIIDLSDKLNSIIGGRGSGKSVFLDSIAYNLSDKDVIFASDKRDFLDKFVVEVYSGKNKLKDNFKFDYFSQSHVNDLFQSHGEEFDNKLLKYFSEDLPTQIVTETEKENQKLIKEYKESFLEDKRIDFENLTSIDEKIIRVLDKQIRPKVMKKNKNRINKINPNCNSNLSTFSK